MADDQPRDPQTGRYVRARADAEQMVRAQQAQMARDFPGLPVHDVGQAGVAGWLAEKREALKDWLAAHTPAPNPDLDLALATTRGGRVSGEIPMIPARQSLTTAAEMLAPKTMADLMAYGVGPVSSRLQRLTNPDFVRVPERFKAEVFRRAVAANKAGTSLTQTPPATLYADATGAPVYYGLNPSPVDPSLKDITAVMNNDPARRGALQQIFPSAIERGGETLDAWAVPNPTHPRGLLPELYERYGFRTYKADPYDLTYGAPSPELEAAWQTQGWTPGDPLPEVQFMVRPTTRPYPRTIPRYAPPVGAR